MNQGSNWGRLMKKARRRKFNAAVLLNYNAGRLSRLVLLLRCLTGHVVKIFLFPSAFTVFMVMNPPLLAGSDVTVFGLVLHLPDCCVILIRCSSLRLFCGFDVSLTAWECVSEAVACFWSMAQRFRSLFDVAIFIKLLSVLAPILKFLCVLKKMCRFPWSLMCQYILVCKVLTALL